MPVDPRDQRSRNEEEQQEYRRRQAARSRKKQKRRQQQLIFLGIIVLGVILLVACVVMIFNAIFGKKTPKPESQTSSVSSMPEPASSSGYTWPTAADPSVWNLKLVNNTVPMEAGYTFEEGSIAQDKVAYYFDARIVGQLTQMIADCNAVPGNSLAIISGRRGETTQNKKYNSLLQQGMDEATARMIDPPAGYSEHQIGLAVDFVTATVQQPSDAFAQTPEYQWLINNCANYGFILRYPENKVQITGFLFQPYHFRYVGVEDAQIITQAGISLEEYLADVSGAVEKPAEEQPPAESELPQSAE